MRTKLIELIATGAFNAEELEFIVHCMLELELTEPEIALFADGTHSLEQMECIAGGLAEGITVNEMELCTDNRLDPRQIEEIISGFEMELKFEEVEIYAKEEFDCYQMEVLRECFLEGLTMSEVATIASPYYNTRVMESMLKRELQFKERRKQKGLVPVRLDGTYLLLPQYFIYG